MSLTREEIEAESEGSNEVTLRIVDNLVTLEFSRDTNFLGLETSEAESLAQALLQMVTIIRGRKNG